ncbi:MAG: nitroreductase family protein [Saprospiraceae bacterium]|nr:nitroreductase family protein [Saprospiraceae bacterium]
MEGNSFIPYLSADFSEEEIARRANNFRHQMEGRRSLRFFSDKDVPKDVISDLIMTASSAPSGAHKQPWTFCAINNKEIKAKIRAAAEKEEYENYHGRMGQEWLKDLEKFETNHIKEFLDTAPWLIVVFKKIFDMEAGEKHKNYYVSESVGIATGVLITAIHQAGLVTLTHTPSPMNFLQEILQRPENEKAFLLLPVGHPAFGAGVPVLQRKKAEEVIVFYE